MLTKAVLVLSLVGLMAWGSLAAAVGAGAQIFSDTPDAAELMAQVNMNHPKALANVDFKNQYLAREMVEVVPGRVYQAVAYCLGYPTVVILDDGTLMLIDPTEDVVRMREIIVLFRQIPAIGNKPFSAVVVTLFHGDHIWALCAILEDVNNVGPVTVYMNSKTPGEVNIFNTFNALKFPRLVKQFGLILPPTVFLHHVAVDRAFFRPAVCPNAASTMHLLAFGNAKELHRVIGNTDVTFISTPGYTVDFTMAYFPSMRLLHSADAYYQSFPNGYPVRGEPPRDIKAWSDAILIAARYPNVDVVLATHGRPKVGPVEREDIVHVAHGLLLAHSQTLRYMQKGREPREIAKHIKLPAVQLARQYNTEVYGMMETTSMAVYSHIVGWFNGRAETLLPVTESQRREKLVDIIGVPKLLVETAKALNDQDYPWALELASMIFRVDGSNRRAKELRTMALIRMAEEQDSIAMRYYFLTCVLDDWGLTPISLDVNTLGSIRTLTMPGVFTYLQTHVDAEKMDAEGVDQTFYLSIDSGTFRFDLTNGVLDVRDAASIPASSLGASMTDADFRAFLLNRSVLEGNVSGGTVAQFTANFDYIDFTDE